MFFACVGYVFFSIILILIGKDVGKITRFLRFLTVFAMLPFGMDAFAVGYVCGSERLYTSCIEGYYLSDCGDAESDWDGRTLVESELAEGNYCASCPESYDCEGGMKCPYNPNSVVEGGFVCEEAYFTCEAGYYLSDCGSNSANWSGQELTQTDVTAGNSCAVCPVGYDCAGGMKCPLRVTIKCEAGQYLPANSEECKICSMGSYCPGGDLVPGDKDAGIVPCDDGTYADEEGLAACKSCEPFHGASIKSDGERDSRLNCYVPADEQVTDETGSFTHVMDCFYE